MKEYTTEYIRNVALVGHQGSGKTSLVEALLFTTGAITRMGKILDGNTVSDFDDDEKARQLSISTAVIPIEFDNHKINILDCPGFTDFVGEVKNAIRVCDSVLVVVDAVSGPEVGTELAWQVAEEFQQPPMIVINKINRENASFERTLAAVRERFPHYKFIPVLLPIGEGQNFKGVINVLTQKAYYDTGKDRSEPPADMVDAISEAHLNLVEAAAEANDELINKYFETQDLSFDEIREGMRLAARNADLKTVPVFVAAGELNVATYPLLEALLVYVSPPSQRRVALITDSEEIQYLNRPQSDEGPLAAYVFKTTFDRYIGTLNYFRVFSGQMKSGATYYNSDRSHDERFGQLYVMRGKEQLPVQELHTGDIGAVAKLGDTGTGDTICTKERQFRIRKPTYPSPVYSVAIDPKTQQDGQKMGATLSQLVQGDPTLHWRQDSDTHQVVLDGMGDIHIGVAIARAERLGTHLSTSVPRVPYKETITKEAKAMHRHKKQSGGSGQFGEVHLRVEPRERGLGFEYVSEVVGGAIDKSFIPSIEKGITGVLDHGVIAGYPVVDVKAAVYDGKMHPVDSKDIAFQTAGREAFKEAVRNAGPVLLEPVMNVRIVVPEEAMGSIMSDLTTRRGRVNNMDSEHGRSVVVATVPLAEMMRYSNDLRSMSGGRGAFTMEFDHYEVVPPQIAQPIMAAFKSHETEE